MTWIDILQSHKIQVEDKKSKKQHFTENSKDEQQKNVVHHYTQAYTKNNNTGALIQTTGGKDEPNIVLMGKLYLTSQHGTEHVKRHYRTTEKN